MVEILSPPKPDIPEPAPGMAVSVAPFGHYLWLEDFEYYDQLGRDPLQQAKLWHITDPEERVAKLKELLESYPKQLHRRNMLYEAAKRGDEALVRYLVATGLKVHPEIQVSPPTAEEEQATLEALENGEILDKDDPWKVPVHAAACYGHVGCLKIFLEEGKVDVDVRDGAGRTPLTMGAKHPEVVRYLLGMGANPTFRECGEGETPQEEDEGEYTGMDALEVAAANGSAQSVELLLEHPFYGSKRKRTSRAGEEPGVWVTPRSIQLAAAAGNGFDVLKLLLERGAYPMEDQEGKRKGDLLSTKERDAIMEATPGAAAGGSLSSLKLLLSYQYPTDQDGNIIPFEVPEELHKPFVYGAYGAMEANSPDKFEFINSFGIKQHETMSLDGLPAGQNFNVQHLFDKAAAAGSIECARLLIKNYGADSNKHRVPPAVKPLYTAAANDKPEMVRFLLESHGADIHLGSGSYATGPTALWIAVVLKSFGSIEYLLRQGGPVDYIDETIRSISDPMTVILRAEFNETAPPVRLETEETAKEYLNEHKKNWQNLNPPFVLLKVGPKDKDWIGKLKLRRPAEELREIGDDAREFNKEEGVAKGDLDDADPRKMLVPFPTVTGREQALKKDDDLLPEFEPCFVPVQD
ncbi:ankyrin repeat-containing domain protein [Xylariales sp. PMI_506]|nr:ankyrin repeat-containing domain protein [Xylariales sp. PMI_506]